MSWIGGSGGPRRKRAGNARRGRLPTRKTDGGEQRCRAAPPSAWPASRSDPRATRPPRQSRRRRPSAGASATRPAAEGCRAGIRRARQGATAPRRPQGRRPAAPAMRSRASDAHRATRSLSSHCLTIDASPHRRWSGCQPGACVTGGAVRLCRAVPYPPQVRRRVDVVPARHRFNRDPQRFRGLAGALQHERRAPRDVARRVPGAIA